MKASQNPHWKFQDCKNVAIVYRPNTDSAIAAAKSISLWLKSKDYQVYTGPDQKLIPGTKSLKGAKAWADICLVIVLGGDGTYLRAVRMLEGRQVPIVGIHMGSLGFLTAYRSDDCLQMIEKTLDGKMNLTPRAMIQAEIYRASKKKAEYHALNDLVIERGSFSQLINLSIYSEKQHVTNAKADGFIISSPTGSTAYNLAAGGPILHPQVKALIVTPVAPHALTVRPIIFPDDRSLSFKLDGVGLKAHFIVDGQKALEITSADEVRVKRSQFDHWFVRSPEYNFFLLLREKLKFGDRA